VRPATQVAGKEVEALAGVGQEPGDDVPRPLERVLDGLSRFPLGALVERVLRDDKALDDLVVDLDGLALPGAATLELGLRVGELLLDATAIGDVADRA